MISLAGLAPAAGDIETCQFFAHTYSWVPNINLLEATNNSEDS